MAVVPTAPLNPVNSNNQFSLAGDSGVLRAKMPAARNPRPTNKFNMSGSVLNRGFDAMYAVDPSEGPNPLGADNLGSSTFRG